MTTISHSPELPAPNRSVAVTFTLTQSGADFVRVWCTVAPTGSRLDGLINSVKDPRNRVKVFEGSRGSVWNDTFDKGGKYTFVAQEYQKGLGYGGGYEGDPNGSATETKLGAEATLSLFIGQKVTQPIGPPSNQATLTLWVWDDTIHATTKAQHGEDTPAISAQSPSPVLKTAIESTSVATALTALDGSDLLAIGTVGDMTTWTHSYRQAFDQHLYAEDGDSVAMHDTEDTFNRIKDTYDNPPDQKAFQEFVNQAIKALKQHVTNDIGEATTDGVFGPDSGEFHMSGGVHLSDRANVPLYESAASFAEAYGALCDLYRCFDSHQRNSSVHDSDVVFTLHATTLLMNVHIAFLRVLASATPTVPLAQSDGVQTLISNAGFKEA